MRLSDCQQPFSSVRRAARERYARALALSLMLLIFAAPSLAANDNYSADIGGATAESALVHLLQSRGLTPPAGVGLSFGDYIETNAGQKGAREVWVSIGADGNITPSSEWRSQHADYCKQGARDMLPVAQRLRFRLFRNAETLDGKTRYQYDVFAGVIDQASGKIKSQQEGQSTIMRDSNAKSGFSENPDAEGLAEPMDDALDRLDIKLGALVGPCGDIHLEHLSGNQVKEPVTFRAGFEGFGRYLNYTWDFGDRTAPEDIGQHAQHIYAKKGTYAVTVKVDGKNIEPGSKTISVVIGGDLVLSFSSRIEVHAPQNSHIVSKFESVVPLTKGAGSVLEGSARLRNVELSNSLFSALQQIGCTFSPRDGTLEVRAVMPAQEPGSAKGIEVFLTMPYDHAAAIQEAVPGANVHCPPALGGPYAAQMKKALAGAGAFWWTGFVALHEKAAQADESFRFAEWEPSNDPSVVARKVYRGSRTEDGPTTFSEVTTLEIRRRSAH